ncbi:MAG: glycosyltransferase family 2 protein [Cyanobacteria bacterium P01_D01_bin.6]
MLSNICVIIPVLNEADTIAGVIRGLQEQGLTQICVVDNGSRDRTATMAAQAGAQVISEPRRGYGQACWSGLQTSMATAAEWILFCDGDGSDDLSQLPDLLVGQDEFDLILGNRRGTELGRQQLTPVQNFGNWLATRLIWLGWGVRYEDLGPLRLIRRHALDHLAMTDRGFGWTVEMQAKAAGASLRTHEIPVNYLPRQGGQSKIAGTVKGSVKAGQVILTTLARLYWQKVRPSSWQRAILALQSTWAQRGLLWLSVLLLTVGSLWALPHGDFLNDPTAVPLFWRGMGLMSVGFVLSWGLGTMTRGWFWAGAIAPRLILLAMYPGDDIWRYMWEGHIQNLGFNPYLLAPSAEVLAPLRLTFWSQINHLDHAAIYPPLAQLGFRLLAAISPSVLLFKLSLVAADLGICQLLSRRFGDRATLLYAWNPLVIYSFAGGAHYDSWFLLPLVAAWLIAEQVEARSQHPRKPAWQQPAGNGKPRWQATKTAFLLGVSIAVKWMSLPVLAFWVWRRWQRVGAVTLMVAGLLPLALAILPFCHSGSCSVLPINSDFVTYGRSIALISPVVDDLWPRSLQPGWLQPTWFVQGPPNWIYALPLGLMVLWGMARWQSLGRFTERYLVVLMLLSPIIHAWYFTWLVPFAVASRNWGTRLVSLSAFVYFALPYQLATGEGGWTLSIAQRFWLWGPFLMGLGISALWPATESSEQT